MSKVIGKMIVAILMLSMVAFFFTLSMVATGVSTPLSNTILFVSAPIMVVALILVNINREC